MRCSPNSEMEIWGREECFDRLEDSVGRILPYFTLLSSTRTAEVSLAPDREILASSGRANGNFDCVPD